MAKKDKKEYLIIRQSLIHLNSEEKEILKEQCHIAKNLYNFSLHNVKKHFEENKNKEKRYLNYYDNYKICKENENYKLLNSNMSQQLLKELDSSVKSFFGLLKLAKAGKYDYKSIRFPKFLDKDGFTTLIVGYIQIKNNIFKLPYSNLYAQDHPKIYFNMPPILKDKKIKEIRIIPKFKARIFEIQYTYETEKIKNKLNKNKYLGIDLGLNNFATCVEGNGKSFIICGKWLKSKNQWYNKENLRLQKIRNKKDSRRTTNRQAILMNKRNNRVNIFILKTARYIINYCIDNKISSIVLGYDEDLQKNIRISDDKNVSSIPISKIKDKLEYLCRLNGINLIIQEESFTSKASFLDGDLFDKDINKDYNFSGKREKGIYISKDGYKINADVNAAYNILIKSKKLKKCKIEGLITQFKTGKRNCPTRIKLI